jgi:hypothetical protein
MTAKSLLPQTFWFRFSLPCQKEDDIPRPSENGRLLDLPNTAALPDMRTLDGQLSWAEVRLGWNSQGLGIAVAAEGVSPVQLGRNRPEGIAVAQFWVDTRDTRTVSRATRFCHRFVAWLQASTARGKLGVRVEQRPIARAIADAPLSRPEAISASAELSQTGWLLELFLPARALHGFDPGTNRRLGFAFQLTDHVREDQFLGVGRDFPVGENPSLWATLELCHEGVRSRTTARTKRQEKRSSARRPLIDGPP